MRISVKSNIDQIVRSLDDKAKKQVPFATATALNSLAQRVALIERKNIKTLFPTARPFTVGGIATKLARKNNPTAIIDLKDITAGYLRPYEFGGQHVPYQGKKLMTDPATGGGKDTASRIMLNQYGNIPRGTYAKLKARPDVFEGKPAGMPNAPYGLWQRPTPETAAPQGKGRKKKGIVKANTGQRLVLLMILEDPLEVKQHLNWHALAEGCIKARWQREFKEAMRQALATAR